MRDKYFWKSILWKIDKNKAELAKTENRSANTDEITTLFAEGKEA